MAGANIEITLDDRQLQHALLLAAADDLTPTMADIGEYLLNAHRER